MRVLSKRSIDFFRGESRSIKILLDELEALLFEADLGVKTSSQLIEGVQQGLRRGELQEPDKVKEFIKQEIRGSSNQERNPFLSNSPRRNLLS